MNQDTHDGTTDGCRLHHFEKNRYFHGKLMTARDMEAEQRYNIGQQRSLSRQVSGEGLLCGLSVTNVQEVGDNLEVTVGPGFALDCCGNPIVVKNASTQELDPPRGDEIYVHLRYDECSKETVPIPGSENACEQECAYNRVLEIFEITYEETEPDYKHVPAAVVDYPTPDDDPADALAMMARSYYDAERDDCGTCEDPSVFIGAFTRSEEEDGDVWSESSGSKRRPFVYTNDMLYAVIAGHVTDFENPHDVMTTLNDVLHDGGNIDLTSTDDSVSIDPDPDTSEVDLVASAESVGALASIDGVSNPGGDVDLESGDGLIDITPDDGANSIDLSVPELENHRSDSDNPHEVTATQVGALASLEEVSGDADGNVDLTSPDDTVTITTDSDTVGEHTVGLSVELPDPALPLEALTERLDRLEERHKRDIERMMQRVTRLEHHVMERSMLCICHSFGSLAERLDFGLPEEIAQFAEEFLSDFDTQERIEPERYYEFLEEYLGMLEDLIGELEDSRVSGTPQFERFRRYVEELRLAFEDREEDDVLPVATAQERVCSTVDCLGVR